MDNLLYFELVNEIICKIRAKLKYYNLTMISTHAPNEGKYEVAKEELYRALEKACDAVTNCDMKTALGDFFFVLLTVHLSIILINNQLNVQILVL